MWHEGTIGIPKGDKYTIAHYWVKAYEEGSEYGINNGRISKLMLKIDGEIVCNYDRGWDVHPTCKAAEVALEILLYEYDNAYYLSINGINLEYTNLKKLFSCITEFASFVNHSEVFASKLAESGKLIMKHNAIRTGIKHFVN